MDRACETLTSVKNLYCYLTNYINEGVKIRSQVDDYII